MLRLRSDLVDLIDAALAQRLDTIEADWDPRPSLGIVMAAANYPETPRSGDVIHGLAVEPAPGAKVFHAGTRLRDGAVVTAGGRVLTACALGDSIVDAQQRAYAATAPIRWDGEFHRADIGWRAIARERG